MDRKTSSVLNSVVRDLFEAELTVDGNRNLVGKLPNGSEVSAPLGPTVDSVAGGAQYYKDAHTPSWWRNTAGWFGDKFKNPFLRNLRDDVLDPRDRAIQKAAESVQDNVDAFKSAQIQKAAMAQAARDQAAATASSGDEPGLLDTLANSGPVRGLARGLGGLSGSRSMHHWGTANLSPMERAGKNASFEAGLIGGSGDGSPVSNSTQSAIAHAVEDVAGQNDPWYTKGMREMRHGVENIGASMADNPWAWGGGLGAAALAAGAGALYLRKKQKEANKRQR